MSTDWKGEPISKLGWHLDSMYSELAGAVEALREFQRRTWPRDEGPDDCSGYNSAMELPPLTEEERKQLIARALRGIDEADYHLTSARCTAAGLDK